MKRLTIAYARQSYQRPDHDSSTVGQHEAIKAYCNQKNITIDQTFSDVGSGKNFNRPQIQQVMKEIQEGKVKSLIIWRVDRISRNTKDLILFYELCEDNGVSIHSINDELLSYNNATDKFKMQILASISELQRNIISENKTMASKEKFKKGQTLNHEPPFGYRYDKTNKKFIIEKDEAETVKVIFDLYNKNYGYKKISQKLEADGDLINRSPAQVRNVVMNIKSTGSYKGKYGMIENALPAIISMETYERANRKRLSKQTQKRIPVEANLKRKITCPGPDCGRNMTTYYYRKQVNSTPKYVCASKMDKQYDSCSMKAIPIKEVEHAVLSAVRRFLTTSSELKMIHDRVLKKIKDINKSHKQTIQVSKVQKEKLIEELAAGEIDLKIFKEKMNDLQSEPEKELNQMQLHKVTLAKLTDIIKENRELERSVWPLIKQVGLNTDGTLSAVYLKGFKENILKTSIKEHIENVVKSK